LYSCSEQELLDCADSYGAKGCDGGWMTPAYSYYEAQGAEPRDVYASYSDKVGIFYTEIFTI
jgi:hypothetical protein